MNYEHFTSFTLTDPKTGKTKSLTNDFGGVIVNTSDEFYERECMPQINFTTVKNDFIDGEIFIDSHYGTRLIELEVFFSEENGGGDLYELKKWLSKKYQQLFRWEDDWENLGIYAIESGNWKSQVYYNKKFYGKISLKFLCHNPYYFKVNERDIKINQGNSLVLNQEYIVKSKGNCDSYPLIKIIPTTSTVVLTWNDLTITLTNLTTGSPIFLDCKKCICYEVINNVNTSAIGKFVSNDFYDFPIINCEESNIIKLISGGILEMIIKPNTLFI
jgi:phage-related protein